MNQMDDVYQAIGDGTNLTFNVATYLNETQTLTNKTIAAIDNNLVINLEELTNVNSTPVAIESILTYDPASSEWIGKEPSVYGPVLESLTPNVAATYDVGSSTYPFRHLFLSNTISLGTETITLDANGDIAFSAPIAASSITSHSVVTQVLTQNTAAVYCAVIGGYDFTLTFNNTTPAWITFPFDKIEAESPAGSFDDINFYEYTVPVDGTYKVTLCMLSPATNPNAEFRLMSSNAITGVVTTYNQGWIFLNQPIGHDADPLSIRHEVPALCCQGWAHNINPKIPRHQSGNRIVSTPLRIVARVDKAGHSSLINYRDGTIISGPI